MQQLSQPKMPTSGHAASASSQEASAANPFASSATEAPVVSAEIDPLELAMQMAAAAAEEDDLYVED